MAAEGDGNATLLKEWETARDVLKGFDEKLHDLRKYGFSFITGLLTIEGMFVSSQDEKHLAPLTAFSVLLANMILILALRLIDRNYEVFQIATATRACLLERVLNIELTDVISLWFKNAHVRWYLNVVYALFIFVVCLLGWSALEGHPEFQGATLFSSIASVDLLVLICISVSTWYPKRGDWTLDRVDCTQGEPISLTVTNLFDVESLEIPRPAWKLCLEGHSDPRSNFQSDVDVNAAELKISARNSYTWLMETETCTPGIYRVFRQFPKGTWTPLDRKIRIRPAKPIKRTWESRFIFFDGI
jgi:hypothetical protein